MTKSLIFVSLLLLLSCESDQKVDLFFERLSVLVSKKNAIKSNLLNRNTTRTEKGGAYIPIEATNCKKGICEIKPLRSFGVGAHPTGAREPILKYEPGHPDANKNGYVAYPYIIVSEEEGKLERVERAISFLLKEIPISHQDFFSEKTVQYFGKYPSLDREYNFKKLIEQ